eukprot:COSAG04_NODE_426_length_14569_cov_7.074153_2_plen_301_part_00
MLEHARRTLHLLLSMANCICCARVFDALRALPSSKFEWDIQVLPRELKTAIIEKLGDKALPRPGARRPAAHSQPATAVSLEEPISWLEQEDNMTYGQANREAHIPQGVPDEMLTTTEALDDVLLQPEADTEADAVFVEDGELEDPEEEVDVAPSLAVDVLQAEAPSRMARADRAGALQGGEFDADRWWSERLSSWNSGVAHTAKHTAAIAASMQGNSNAVGKTKGNGGATKGRKQTAEHKAKIADGLRDAYSQGRRRTEASQFYSKTADAGYVQRRKKGRGAGGIRKLRTNRPTVDRVVD